MVDEVVVESLLDALDGSVVLTWSEQRMATFSTKSAEVVVSFSSRSPSADEWDLSYSVTARDCCTLTEVVLDAVVIYGGVIHSIEQFKADQGRVKIYVGKGEVELNSIYQAHQRRKGAQSLPGDGRDDS
jgi:hypothetical protein